MSAVVGLFSSYFTRTATKSTVFLSPGRCCSCRQWVCLMLERLHWRHLTCLWYTYRNAPAGFILVFLYDLLGEYIQEWIKFYGHENLTRRNFCRFSWSADRMLLINHTCTLYLHPHTWNSDSTKCCQKTWWRARSKLFLSVEVKNLHTVAVHVGPVGSVGCVVWVPSMTFGTWPSNKPLFQAPPYTDIKFWWQGYNCLGSSLAWETFE